jgi:hypothetical protein
MILVLLRKDPHKSEMKKDPFEHHFQTKVEEGVHKSLIIILEKLLFACLFFTLAFSAFRIAKRNVNLFNRTVVLMMCFNFIY